MKKITIVILITAACFMFASCANVEIKGVDQTANITETYSTYTDTSYTLERNGISLHLDCMNSDNVDAEANILLVHGLTYSSHEFDVDYKDYSLVRFLCDNGYSVWRLDIAGYGQSERVEDGFTVDSEYASKDVEAAIDEIIQITGADTIDLLGWSWGTVTTSLAEEEYYDVIDKYVLYAPILSGLGKADVTDDYHENTWENAASDFQLNDAGLIDNEITEDMVVNTYCSNCWRYDGDSSPNGGRRDLCVDSSNILIDLTKIKDPTLLICGDKDPYMNMTLVNEALDKLPEGSELKIIEGGAHCVMMEKPYYHEFQESLIDFLKADDSGEDFFSLSAKEQIAAYDAMDSETAYETIKESNSSWCVTSYDLITPENVKDFVIIYANDDGTTSFNLSWPIYGGYEPDTIASIEELSGKVSVSRVGGDSGYCICYGTNEDGSQYTMSQRSVPVSSSEATTGVMDVDLYKQTAEIVTGSDTDDEKVTKLKDAGIDEESAKNMLNDYTAWLKRSEIAGANNIQDGIASVGHTVTPDYGYYGKTIGWKVSNLTLEGGSGQMNTIYSWGTLKSSGIVTDIETTMID